MTQKTVFLSHLYIILLILPRQARDKHRESSQKKTPIALPRQARDKHRNKLRKEMMRWWLLFSQVILVGDYKLLTAERGNTHQGFFVFENGWQNASRPTLAQPDGYWCGNRTPFSRPFCTTGKQTIIWPRQAQDRHRKRVEGKRRRFVFCREPAPSESDRCGAVKHGPCKGENCLYSPEYWNATTLRPCLFDLKAGATRPCSCCWWCCFQRFCF